MKSAHIEGNRVVFKRLSQNASGWSCRICDTVHGDAVVAILAPAGYQITNT